MPPHTIEEVGLGYHSFPLLDEEHEEIKRLRLQMHSHASASDLATRGIDLNLVKPIHRTSLAACERTRFWSWSMRRQRIELKRRRQLKSARLTN